MSNTEDIKTAFDIVQQIEGLVTRENDYGNFQARVSNVVRVYCARLENKRPYTESGNGWGCANPGGGAGGYAVPVYSISGGSPFPSDAGTFPG